MDQGLVAGAGIFCVLIVVLVTVAAMAARGRERRRSDRLRAWAQHHGWTVVERPAVDWGRRLPGGNRAGVAVLLSTVVRRHRISVGEYTVTDVQITTVTEPAAPHRRSPPRSVPAGARGDRPG